MTGLGPSYVGTAAAAAGTLAALANGTADQLAGMKHDASSAYYFTVAGDLELASGVFRLKAIAGPSAGGVLPISQGELQWTAAALAKLSQAPAAAGVAPTSLVVSAQPPNAASITAATNTGANLDLVYPVPGANTVAGNEAYARVLRGAFPAVLVGKVSSQASGIWLNPNIGAAFTPTQSNWNLAYNVNNLLVSAASQISFNINNAGPGYVIYLASGTQFFNSGNAAFGGGNQVIGVGNATTNPTTKPVGGGVLWERLDGSAFAHFGSGGAQCDVAPSGTGTANTQAFVTRMFKFVGASPLSMAATALGSINLNAYRGKQIDVRILYQARDTTTPFAGAIVTGQQRAMVANTGGVVAVQASLLEWTLASSYALSGVTFDSSVTDVLTFKGASPNAEAWDWTLTVEMYVN